MNTTTILAAIRRTIIANALAGLCLIAMRSGADVTVSTALTNALNEPYGVALDGANNIYITDSGNNRILVLDANSQIGETFVGLPADGPGSNDGFPYQAHFNNPEGLMVVSMQGTNGLLVTDNGNNLLRFVRLSDGLVTTIAGQVAGGSAVDAAGLNATFRYPVGMDIDTNGNVYIADFGNNAIRVVNMNDPAHGVTNLVVTGTTFFRPTAVAAVGSSNQLWVADTGNQQIKLINLTSPTSGTLASSLGGYKASGTLDSAFGPSARFNGPSGLFWLDGTGLLISDTLNNSIRLATNYASFGATNYAVVTFAGTPGSAGLVNGGALSAEFNSPYGIAPDPNNNGLLVADLKNNTVRRIQLGPVLPPVPTPEIGWVDFVKDAFGDLVSLLRVGQSFSFNNDVDVQILGTAGTITYFTYGQTPANPLQDTIPNPNASNGSTPPAYHDGLHPGEVPPSIILSQPDVTVKAIGTARGRINSSIATCRFQFQCGAPNIQGNNSAQFTVNETTIGAAMWYTTDGTDPTNAPPSIGPISDGATLSINTATNFTFKVQAFRNNYQPSPVATKMFSVSNFVANTITFGFSSGEASSDFIGAPGQFFYAPVTLNLLPATFMYSLQFNMSATNGGPNPGPPIAPGALGFRSMLFNKVTGSFYERIPPAMYIGYITTNVVTNIIGTNIIVFTNITTGYPIDPPPASKIITHDGLPFLDLTFINSSNNLMGVGWLERPPNINLYNTLQQDLITYSSAHDTLFNSSQGSVIVGGFGFSIPASATPGQTYKIQLGRPSATSDGIGKPGSGVYIATPTNGSLTAGTVNATKVVTAGQRKYIAGDCAPFRWFNAGDFGDTNLDNSDVIQVFQSASYGLDNPPPGSDFFDSMDSCGATYVDNGRGYLEFGSLVSGTSLNPLFDGNDTTINQMAFGDGVLDVCDVFVTFRRSLDPSLVWFRRFWTNGVLAAEIVGNPPPPQAAAAAQFASVNFVSGDAQATTGQTIQVPLTAQVFGSYPLRVVMLNVSIVPLDGSPEITSPIQFTPAGGLGSPTYVSQRGAGNFAATWLNSSIAGLTSNATLGTLSVPIPSTATSSSAYAVHFDHASGSPNGIASFQKKTYTGLITLSDRSTSSYNDGIPDSWRLRYFGTVNNLLSVASADADGDGMSNWQEYIAGTDPTDPSSTLSVTTDQAARQQAHDCVIRWPSVSGKSYVIERSAQVFPPAWVPVSTNIGTGGDMEIHDTSGGNMRYYRVQVQ